MAFQLESYTPGEREDYLRLLRDAWGESPLSAREFDWWFERNPAGSLMSVARDDGRVIGVASHSLYRMVLEGKERVASFSVHATTDASARGRGVFPALEQKHEDEATARDVAVVLAFASKPTAPIFLGPLGWRRIAKLRVWARPLPSFARSRGAADRLHRFTHEGDAASRWPNHVVRDAEFLNWRYVESPKGYECFSTDDGYAVLGHKRHRGVPVAVIADLVATDAQPLLRACVAGARRGTRAVLALPDPEQRRAYAASGFIPTPLSLDFMGKELAARLNTDAGAWRFALGDTDFF